MCNMFPKFSFLLIFDQELSVLCIIFCKIYGPLVVKSEKVLTAKALLDSVLSVVTYINLTGDAVTN